eukprot:TRINITY_DN9119_c0_g1_i1.p1 TRINITY_DN9119_c0_g1~~TRINITY_DN9119_c0_g1_i1.p1  ORF type:complete len:1589 (+),score=511.24 TRINITY_DN9119_c0_g1_i1:42-4769(+)
MEAATSDAPPDAEVVADDARDAAPEVAQTDAATPEAASPVQETPDAASPDVLQDAAAPDALPLDAASPEPAAPDAVDAGSADGAQLPVADGAQLPAAEVSAAEGSAADGAETSAADGAQVSAADGAQVSAADGAQVSAADGAQVSAVEVSAVDAAVSAAEVSAAEVSAAEVSAVEVSAVEVSAADGAETSAVSPAADGAGEMPAEAEQDDASEEAVSPEPLPPERITVLRQDTIRKLLSPGVPLDVPLAQLTVVDFCRLGLTHVEAGCLLSLQSLEMLLLAHNHITSIEGVFETPPPRLWAVDVSFNPLSTLPAKLGKVCLGLLRLDGTSVTDSSLDVLRELCCVELSYAATPLVHSVNEAEMLKQCGGLLVAGTTTRTGQTSSASLPPVCRVGLQHERARRLVEHLSRSVGGRGPHRLTRERARFLGLHFATAFCQQQSCPSQWIYPRDPTPGLPFRATKRHHAASLAYVNDRLLPLQGLRWHASAVDGAPLYTSFWVSRPHAAKLLAHVLLAASHFPTLPAPTLHTIAVHLTHRHGSPKELTAVDPPPDALSTQPTEIIAGCLACSPSAARKVLLAMVAEKLPAVASILAEDAASREKGGAAFAQHRCQVACKLCVDVLGDECLKLLPAGAAQLKTGQPLCPELLAAAATRTAEIAAKERDDQQRQNEHGGMLKDWVGMQVFAHELMWRNEKQYSAGDGSLALSRPPTPAVITVPTDSVEDTSALSCNIQSAVVSPARRRHQLNPALLTPSVRAKCETAGTTPTAGVGSEFAEETLESPSEAAEDEPPVPQLSCVPAIRPTRRVAVPCGGGVRRCERRERPTTAGDSVLFSDVPTSVKRRQAIPSQLRTHLFLQSGQLRSLAAGELNSVPVHGTSAPKGAPQAFGGSAVKAGAVAAPRRRNPAVRPAAPTATSTATAVRAPLAGEPVFVAEDASADGSGSWRGFVTGEVDGGAVAITEDTPASTQKHPRDVFGRLVSPATPQRGVAGYHTPQRTGQPARRGSRVGLDAKGPQRFNSPCGISGSTDEAAAAGSDRQPAPPRRLVVLSSLLRWSKGWWVLAAPPAPAVGDIVRLTVHSREGNAWVVGVDLERSLATLADAHPFRAGNAERERVWVDLSQLQWLPCADGQMWLLLARTPMPGDMVLHPEGHHMGQGWVLDIDVGAEEVLLGEAPPVRRGSTVPEIDDTVIRIKVSTMRWRRGAWVVSGSSTPPRAGDDMRAVQQRRMSCGLGPEAPVSPSFLHMSSVSPGTHHDDPLTPSPVKRSPPRPRSPDPHRRPAPAARPPTAGSTGSIAEQLAASGRVHPQPTQWSWVPKDSAGRRPVIVDDPQSPFPPFVADALLRISSSRRRRERVAESRTGQQTALKPLECSKSLAGARRGYAQGDGGVFLPSTFRTQLAEAQREASRPNSAARPPTAPRRTPAVTAAATLAPQAAVAQGGLEVAAPSPERQQPLSPVSEGGCDLSAAAAAEVRRPLRRKVPRPSSALEGKLPAAQWPPASVAPKDVQTHCRPTSAPLGAAPVGRATGVVVGVSDARRALLRSMASALHQAKTLTVHASPSPTKQRQSPDRFLGGWQT